MNVDSEKLKIVIYIIIINTVISLIYLISRFIKKDYKRGVIMTLFIALTPPVGAIYLTVSWLMYIIYFKNRKAIISIEELSLSKDKIEVISKADINSAINKVPLEESLIVSGQKDSRRMMLDILKEDRGDYIKSIYNATDNKDSEVSHYAAAAITDIIDRFKEKEKCFKKVYNRDKYNTDIGEKYWEYLSEFLMIKVLSSVEQNRYFKILEDLTIELETFTPEIVRAELYYRLVSISIDLKNMVRAEFWVNKTLRDRTNQLESYKAGLKFYYENDNIGQFKKLLDKLKASDIRLDRETLDIIRFYK